MSTSRIAPVAVAACLLTPAGGAHGFNFVDLLTLDSSGAIDGVVFQQYTASGAGSGAIDAFVPLASG